MTSNDRHIRIIIADARPNFRKMLRTFLASTRDMTVVGEASDEEGLLALAGSLKPDVLLVDATLLSSLDGRAKALAPIRTLVTVSTPNRANIIRAFLQGAKAVVPRLSAPHVWPDRIRTVEAGQYWLDEESIAILILALRDYFSQRTETKSPKDYKLTRREVEIISKIANGHSNKEVGQAFAIRERTVKHHLTHIFTKIGVSSRLELALFAVNHRLVETTSFRDSV